MRPALIATWLPNHDNGGMRERIFSQPPLTKGVWGDFCFFVNRPKSISEFAKRPQFRYNFVNPESGGNLSLFITFEGIEGCGKTTQIGLLTSFLKSLHRPFLLTREPGGTGVGERIRQILLSSENVGIEPMAELYLYAAARVQHLRQVISPALREGKMVICDRFADATLAYQGYGRGVDLA